MIEDGDISATEIDGNKVPKSRSDQDKEDFTLANLNSKVIGCIINELSCNELHKVMNVICANEVQNYLEVTYQEPMR